jgi:hypothetical protein
MQSSFAAVVLKCKPLRLTFTIRIEKMCYDPASLITCSKIVREQSAKIGRDVGTTICSGNWLRLTVTLEDEMYTTGDEVMPTEMQWHLELRVRLHSNCFLKCIYAFSM